MMHQHISQESVKITINSKINKDIKDKIMTQEEGMMYIMTKEGNMKEATEEDMMIETTGIHMKEQVMEDTSLNRNRDKGGTKCTNHMIRIDMINQVMINHQTKGIMNNVIIDMIKQDMMIMDKENKHMILKDNTMNNQDVIMIIIKKDMGGQTTEDKSHHDLIIKHKMYMVSKTILRLISMVSQYTIMISIINRDKRRSNQINNNNNTKHQIMEIFKVIKIKKDMTKPLMSCCKNLRQNQEPSLNLI